MEEISKIFDGIKSLVAFLALFGITFEVLPVKLSPLKWLGDKLNKNTNDEIASIKKDVEALKVNQQQESYNNDMKDLRNVKSRIHGYGMLLIKGQTIPVEVLKSALDDLDVYDYYKEKYGVMEINGNKVKINGEVEVDRKLITKAYMEYSNKKCTK